MNEDQLWQLYFQEQARQTELEAAYKNASENDGQIMALSQLQYQRGRVGLLLELTSLVYIESMQDFNNGKLPEES